MSDSTEFANGVVVFEIDMFLASDSGRPKHTDVEGQGVFLLDVLREALEKLEPGPGLGFGSIRYMGEGRVDREALQEREIRQKPTSTENGDLDGLA